MKEQPNKAIIKGRLTTPWKKEMLPSFGFDIWSGERCICTMDDYPDAEKDADLIVESVNNHAELRERVRELENLLTIWVKQNNYLRRHSISDFDDIHDQTKKSLKR